MNKNIIINPLTNQQLSIFSTIGRNVLKKYILQYNKIGGNDICAICRIDFQRGDNIVTLDCGGRHKYHKKCIEGWFNHLLRTNNKLTCPLCVQEVEPSDELDLINNDWRRFERWNREQNRLYPNGREPEVERERSFSIQDFPELAMRIMLFLIILYLISPRNQE